MVSPGCRPGPCEAPDILGVMYSQGKGVPQDYFEAVGWFRLAADQGDAIAQGALGAMYAKGKASRRTMCSHTCGLIFLLHKAMILRLKIAICSRSDDP